MPIIGCDDLAKAGTQLIISSRNLYRIAGTGATYVAQAGDTIDLGAIYCRGGSTTARLGLARVSDGVVLHTVDITPPDTATTTWYESETSFDLGAIAGTEVQLFQTFFGDGGSSDPTVNPFWRGPGLIADTVHLGEVANTAPNGMSDFSGEWLPADATNLAYFNVVQSSTIPTITNINTTNEVTPGVTATLTGTNLTNATGINIGSVSQSNLTVVNDTTVTFTGTRGGNPYSQDLTATLLSPDGDATITVQQVPEAGTFAVTASSPNTTDDASLWSGLIDTATSNPVTVVDGDQALVTDPNNLGNLAVTPGGEISADTEGDFTVQFWRASEGVWGGDQTVTFEVPVDPPADSDWPFGKGVRPAATQNWTYGSRHPMTGMRVRIFK